MDRFGGWRAAVWLAALAAGAAVWPASAGWVGADGQALPETEGRRSSGPFGAQLLLAADEAAFREAWAREPGPPHVLTIDRVGPDREIGGMILFHGCQSDPAGRCRVTVQFSLESPDGQVEPAGGGPVWSLGPAPGGEIRLGQSSLGLSFEASDPPGVYRVWAEVEDRVAKRRLRLSAPVQRLAAPEGPLGRPPAQPRSPAPPSPAADRR